MTDRKTRPAFETVKSLQFADYQKLTAGDVPFYTLRAGAQPVIRLDLVFDGGLIRQDKKGIASFTASMISEGSAQKSAKELAEALDYYGSYVQARGQSDDAVITLYCLEKHLQNCLSIFTEAITTPVFPEKELEIQKKNSIQKLRVNEKKNSYLCKKGFYQNVFGPNHPYAAFSEKPDLEQLNPQQLKDFYSKHYRNGLKYVMLSGLFEETAAQQVAEMVKQIGFSATTKTNLNTPLESAPGKHFLERNDTVQSAVRIGKKSIHRNHPDFRKLQFLNLIFGGYFGSRLMKNIREDKGLTYGIYSVVEPYQNASAWYIDTDMNTDKRALGIREIYEELRLIREAPIPETEITTARNYMLGSFLRSLDGPFSLADRLKIMIDNQLPDTYYADFVKELNEMNPVMLQEIAQTYFTEADIVEMVVGKS